MGRQALALPKAEPLLHMPITSIVELVSNRSEAEVLFRIGDLAHEFDHLTAVLVQWLEHQQFLRVQCGVEHQQPVQDAGDSPLLSSLAPLLYQARAVNRHGVRVLQQRITECLQQLQRHMNAVQVFANQNASFSQELRLCGILPRAEQRRRLAETEAALASRLSKFLGGCDSFYDEPPLSPLATKRATEVDTRGVEKRGTATAAAAAGVETKATSEADTLKPAGPGAPERTPALTAASVPVAGRSLPSVASAAARAPHVGERVCPEARKRRPACDHTQDPKQHNDGAPSGLVGRKRSALPQGRGGGGGGSGAGSESCAAGFFGRINVRRPAARGRDNELSQEQKRKGDDDDDDDGGDGDDDFAAPSFLTPPVVAVAPTDGGTCTRGRGGGGGDASFGLGAGGLVAAPPSACSSLGSTQSGSSLSPALAMASPLPLPTRSSPRRSPNGENRCSSSSSSRKRARAVATAAAASADGGGGGGDGSSSGCRGLDAAGAVSPHEEQLQSSGSCSATPPSTREPSPLPLSTQEGSGSPADGGESDGRDVPRANRPNADGNGIVTGRTDPQKMVVEAGNRSTGGGGGCLSYGFSAARTGPGGIDEVVAGGSGGTATAMAGSRSTAPEDPPRASGTRGSGGVRGDPYGGVPEFVLRVPRGAAGGGGRVAASAARQESDSVLLRPGQRGDTVKGTGMAEGKRCESGAAEEEEEEEEEEEDEDEQGEDEEDTVETVEDSALPTAGAVAGEAPSPPPPMEAPCWGSQDGADEAGGTDAEVGVGARTGRRAGVGRDFEQYSPR